MCYSTNNTVDPKTEVTYNESLPYGRNGYRTNCNNIPVNMILWLFVPAGISFFMQEFSKIPCCES